MPSCVLAYSGGLDTSVILGWLIEEGYDVVFQPFSGGEPSGKYEVFADGFAGGTKQPGSAAHRPSGLAQGPDGSLFVSDDAGGRIWRITYAAP